MISFFGTRISDHISETPEGFLVCHGAPLARTATRVPQKYRGRELGLRTDDTVDVYRAPEEVLSRKFLASLEGKPVTDQHPERFLDASNVKWYIRGHAQNVRPGPQLPDGEQSIVGDLVVTDAALIDEIKRGVRRELSVGYHCEYDDNGDGSYSQTHLRANHIAVVTQGRAGEHVRIMDHSAVDGVTEEMLTAARPRDLDELADELAVRYDQEAEEEGLIPMKRTADNDQLMAVLERLITAVNELVSERTRAKDEEGALEEIEAVDAHPSLAKLRQLRPLIAASGDRQAIDSYNNAIQALKKLGRSSSHVVSDAHTVRVVVDPDRAWEEAIRRAGAQMRGEQEKEPAKKLFGVRAQDSTSRSDDEEWSKDVGEVGKRLREGKLR